MAETDYGRWLSSSKTGQEELAAMRQQVVGLRYLPLVSLVLMVSDHDEVWIKNTVDSVLGQVYPRLELCICDNGSGRQHVPEVLEDYAAVGHVKVRRLPERQSWAKAYNEAISMTTGEFVALLEAGDEIAPEAIFMVVELLQGVPADMIYTDEDHIDISGRRSDPVFKPYWSPDLLLSTAYTGRLCLMRRSILEAPEVFREGFEGAEEHDLILHLSEKTDRVHHLPEVLYHRRRLPEVSGSVSDRSPSSSRAVEDALVRRGTDATVELGLVKGSFRVVRRVGGHPRVSVVVSATEGIPDVSIVDELKRQTSYPIHQVIVAGGGREVRASADDVDHPVPARALNLAAAKAEGEYLVFMDARAKPTTPGWLLEMLRQAQRREVGAVGCMLLNASGGLRHGGSLVEMVLLTGAPEEPVSEGGHYLPLVDHAFNFGAASAECMMVRRALFDRVEGFDDEKLPTAFYDLDLSFRLRENGLLNVYTPHASLICESPGDLSVGTLPGEEEIEYMWRRWWRELVRLLYYRSSPLYTVHHGMKGGVLPFLSS